MKKWLLSLFTTTFCYVLFAQQTEGLVTYERKINLHKRITDEQIKAYMPEFRTSKHQLIFNQTTSIYKAVVEQDATEESAEGGGRTFVRMGGGGESEELFKDWAALKTIRQTDLGSKTYIIEDSIVKPNWQITTETKTILGYTCYKAISKQKRRVGGFRMMSINNDTATKKMPTEEEVDVIAWFVKDIETASGPENNGGLPGLILAIDVNNGETLIVATDIKKEFNKKDLKQPTKGKKITSEEFNKLVKQMMENMQQAGGGGFRTMRTGN